MPRVPTIDDIDVDGKKVLMRVDFNSPIDPDTGKIIDDTRIRAHIPTIKELAFERNAALVLISHQGRPGEPDFVTLEEHAERLSKYLGEEVKFVDDVMGPAARKAIDELRPGEILLLDNVRFCSEEIIEAKPERQAKTWLVRKLAPLFNCYVNDAFATAHRSQPSIVGFPLVLPSAAGRLMQREVEALSRAFHPEASPKVFVLGGGKVYDTVRIVEHIVKNKVADRILTTGLVAELFMVAKGMNLGEANMKLLDEKGILGLVSRARRILLAGAPIETPVDFVVLKDDGSVAVEPANKVSGRIMDVGPATVEMYSSLMKEAEVIVMRGPAGVMEDERFRKGTYELVKAALEAKAFVIFGGGHLSGVIRDLKPSPGNWHLSTGGGALLLFLAGETLPALQALEISAKKHLGW